MGCDELYLIFEWLYIMKRVLITGKLNSIALEILAKEENLHVDNRPDLGREEILKIVGDYHCIISRSETDIDQKLIDCGKNLEVIARAAVGVGNIDVDYATKKGILVFNTPAKNTNSAAELTISLLLAVTRKVVLAHKTMEAGGWERHKFTGSELRGKTVGIVGLGNVGHRVAKFLNSFDCELLAYDPYVTSEHCQRNHTKKVSFEVLLEKSDIVTLHVPKNKETINMITEEQIMQMKDGVILINAARGGLIQEYDLAKALESGKVFAAGIDTWDVEPVTEHPLKNFSNVVMTPHIGASTVEAQKAIAETVAQETIIALQGGIVSTPVNMPQMQTLEGSLAKNYSVLAEKLGSLTFQYLEHEFSPERIEFLYRGELEAEESWDLIKISFLKGFLSGMSNDVSYVNALQVAEEKGYSIAEEGDENFTDYESAIRIQLSNPTNTISVGGTVFGRDRLRLSYLDGFVFEINPSGVMLIVKNQDFPGAVGHIGTILAKHEININQFELSRKEKGGNAMAAVLVDNDVSTDVIKDLKSHGSIQNVTKVKF